MYQSLKYFEYEIGLQKEKIQQNCDAPLYQFFDKQLIRLNHMHFVMF